MSDRFSVFDFVPPGPVAAAWIDDATTPIPLLMGPAGSGKTTAACFKGPRMIARHMPVCRDGVIRGRITVIRDNYRRLYDTAIRSWHQFFPPDFPGSEWRGGQDRPAHHRLRFRTPRGPMELEVDFFAVGDLAIEEMLKGYETTIGWMNEADLLTDRVPTFLYSRTGRFPSRSLLVEPEAMLPRQVFGDLNPPDIDHWVHQWTVDEPRAGVKLYRQPSGLSAAAENRAGKPRQAYESEAAVMDGYDCRRFVHGEFGYSRDGLPVYDKLFDIAAHVAPAALAATPQLPIHIGLDAGMEPAAVIDQLMPNGQTRTLAEIVAEPGTGPGRFAEMLLDRLLSDFRGVPVGSCWGDPSAFYGADRIAGELAWMETVARAIGHNIQPAPSNEPGIRIEAVAIGLRRRIDKDTPAILIDPRCRMLIGGYAAHYKFHVDRNSSLGNSARPVKNRYSHVHDANQYVKLGLRGRYGVIEDAARAGRPGNVVPIVSGRPRRADFSVWDL